MTVLYGSSVADTTLATACDMASASGGTETSKVTTGNNTTAQFYLELLSQGGSAQAAVASLPTPTGKGWAYQPGAGTFATGNWSAVLTLQANENLTLNSTNTIYVRFYKYNAGSYTSLGQCSIASQAMNTTKTTYTITASSLAAATFLASDFLYIDLWVYHPGNWAGYNTAPAVTVFISTSATAGVASDMQVTTSTFTPASSGNTIVGLARAVYLEAIAQKGLLRSRFAESIASFGRIRSKFTLSIGSKQASRSKFLVSIAQKGVSRSKFVVSRAIKGLSRSNYLISKASRGLARSKFVEASTQKSQSRSKFLISFKQATVSRAKFLISIAQRGITHSTFVLSKASRGLARAKFAEAIAQRSPARSKFSLSATIKGAARSTFKIAISGGHAITAYMRSRYRVSIRQAQAQRSKFLIRFSQASQARSRYFIRFAQAAQFHTHFLVRFGVTGRARSHYLLSIRQTALARSHFIIRLALVVKARSRFLVQGILVTYPIKSITHAVSQVLSAAWNVLSALGLVSSHAPALTVTHQELAMPAPYTTILPTITVTDINGALVSNASAVSLVVYFPDSSTSNLSLGSGITNLGGGQYQAKYNTKGPGEIREVWSIIGADGTTLASAQFLVGVEY